MLNENLINTVCKASAKYNTSYILKNSNQGSTPEKIINNKYKKINFFYSDTDNNKNLDLSISKINRFYIFNIFLKKFPNLYKIKIKDFHKLISKNKYANQILTYFNDKKINNIKKCPNCKCLDIQKIQNTLTPNVIGFLDNRNLYSNCLRCGYIFLNKQIDEKDLYIYYKNYTYPPVSKKKIKEIAKKPNAENVSHFLNYKNIENEFRSKNKMSILDLGGEWLFCFLY
jgi:predicted Zn-ribbon and HTH transcriptional regulator